MATGTIDGLARDARLGPRVVGQRRQRPVLQASAPRPDNPGLDGIVGQPIFAAGQDAPGPQITLPTITLPRPRLPRLTLPRLRVPYPAVHRTYQQVALGVFLATALAGTSNWLWPHHLHRQSPAAATAPAVAAHQTPATTGTVPSAELSTTLQNFANTTGVPTGIAVIDLKTGLTYETGSDRVFVSASLYKLFVAEAVYTALDHKTIAATNAVAGTGTNVTECLRLMITISDNDCGAGLGNMVGWEKQNSRWNQQGYVNTHLARSQDQKTSAGDVTLLLKRLHEGTLLSPTSNDSFIKLLKDQKVNNRLPQGLPAGTTIAHKTGDLDGYIHDAGIVYGPNGDYIITMMTGPWKNTNNAPPKFAELAKRVNAIMAAQK
jgi:beta-lactamase class A